MIPYEIINLCVHIKNLKPVKAILVKECKTINIDYKIWDITLENESTEKIIQFKSNSKDASSGEVTAFISPELEELIKTNESD